MTTDLDELMKLHAASHSRVTYAAYVELSDAAFYAAAHAALPKLVTELKELRELKISSLKALAAQQCAALVVERDAWERRAKDLADLLEDRAVLSTVSRLTEERDALKTELSETQNSRDDLRCDYDELKAKYERLEKAARAVDAAYVDPRDWDACEELRALKAALAPEPKEVPKAARSIFNARIRMPRPPRATVQSVLEQHGVKLTVPPQPDVKDGHTVMAPMAAVEVEKSEREYCERAVSDFLHSYGKEDSLESKGLWLKRKRAAAVREFKARVLAEIDSMWRGDDTLDYTETFKRIEALK